MTDDNFSHATEDLLVEKVTELSNIYARSSGMSPEDYHLYSTAFLLGHFEIDAEKAPLDEAFKRSGSLTQEAVIVKLFSTADSSKSEIYHLDPLILKDKRRLEAVFKAQQELVKKSPILPPRSHVGGKDVWHLEVHGMTEVLNFC